jgi:hypothetical protein
MSTKKIALELLLKINSGDLTLEGLNEELALAKQQMAEIGDDGSEEFKALSQVVEDAEASIEGLNGTLDETKEGFDKTADAQKKATEGSGTFSKGLKAVGTAFKAMGIGLVIAALKFLFDALSQNQKVMDAVTVVTETISIIFSKVVDTLIDVVSTVSESSKGFDGLKNVILGLLTLAITPLKLSFYAIKLAMQSAQLAWEQSFFGDGDPETIKELRAGINETKDDIAEVGKNAVKAGISVANNLGKAANEIGGVVSGVVNGISEISVKGAIAQAKSIKDVENAARIAAAQQGLLLEQYDRLAEKQRQIRDDERVGITERIAANVQLGVELEKQEKAMLAQANLQIAAAQAQVNKNRNVENETALIEALANKAGVLAAVEGFRSEQKVNAASLDREQLALNTTLSKSEADLAYERKKFNAEQIEDKIASLEALRDLEEERQQEEMLRLEGIVEATNAGTQAEVDALILLDEFREASRQANIEANKAIITETLAQNKKLADAEKKDNEDKIARNEERVAIATSTLAGLGNLAKLLSEGNEKDQKKAFAINKAASIGQAVINTATGITKAFAQGGVGGFATGAAVAIAGAAQIAAIAKTQFKSTAGDVSSPSDSGGGVGSQPRSFTSPRVDTNQQTTKVIVTETDIRSVTGNVSGIYNRAVVVE